MKMNTARIQMMAVVFAAAATGVCARTIAEWPLGCDENLIPDGRCAVSSANDLLIVDADQYCELGTTGRYALHARGGAGATDFAFSDTAGHYLTPTNDFTVEGWYNFSRLPEKGETWMVVSAFTHTTNRWFLTFRRDSIHPGLTWQIFSAAPYAGDSLLTTVTDPNTLTNGWHHFALTFAHRIADGTAEWCLYLDGQPAGRKSMKPFQGSFDEGGRFGLGGRGRAGNVICGSLSQCRLSDRVLSPDQFLQPDTIHRGQPQWKTLPSRTTPETPDGGRTLYNGITLPKEWPPRIDPRDPNPIRAPYLEAANIPVVIPIDLGRQLFVDDFLVESITNVTRAFHKPVQYAGNPVMWPQTKDELTRSPGCCMPGGAIWWDPTRQRFRIWYLSGWAGKISLAESKDGIHWERPPVGASGTNVLLPHQIADTFSVWPDYAAKNPYERWCMSISPGGNPTRSAQYVSRDGVRWTFARLTGQHGDSTTMFYNPFLGKWVWSLRASWRARSRIYRAHQDFIAGGSWNFPMGHGPNQTNTADCALWLACDNQDLPRTVGRKEYRNAQLYNVDATPYESIMVGFFKILCGRDNDLAAKAGMPKTTTLHFAYSRDGFHFTRPDRTPAIADSGWGSGRWDSGYVGPCSSGFVIKDEQLWLYYVGARGDGTQNDPPTCVIPNGMHWNFSVGVAILRRDGFASMTTDAQGELVTRPVVFTGSHLFVNADARFGTLAVEVLDENGKPFAGYSADDCTMLVREDTTKRAVTWKGGDLARFAGKPVRFRFKLRVASLYSFWVSAKPTGESGGYLAAGGPAYSSLRDE